MNNYTVRFMDRGHSDIAEFDFQALDITHALQKAAGVAPSNFEPGGYVTVYHNAPDEDTTKPNVAGFPKVGDLDQMKDDADRVEDERPFGYEPYDVTFKDFPRWYRAFIIVAAILLGAWYVGFVLGLVS